MADAVTSLTISDGAQWAVIKLTNVSDATGEAAVAKVTPSALSSSQGAACTGVIIHKIWYATSGMSATLLWDATTDVAAYTIPADVVGEVDLSEFGGIRNNAGAGVTGVLNLTTTGHAAGDSYMIVLKLKKIY